ncbi:hypothetical protein XaC1_257 [Xanthomonas phage XaC1]|nr:hypothetical protein XaC1_257 [Xanthomonas phage XaC1]
MITKLKTIDEFTKEELFKFYEEIRTQETYVFNGDSVVPNEHLLDDIEYLVKDMEKQK